MRTSSTTRDHPVLDPLSHIDYDGTTDRIGVGKRSRAIDRLMTTTLADSTVSVSSRSRPVLMGIPIVLKYRAARCDQRPSGCPQPLSEVGRPAMRVNVVPRVANRKLIDQCRGLHEGKGTHLLQKGAEKGGLPGRLRIAVRRNLDLCGQQIPGIESQIRLGLACQAAA